MISRKYNKKISIYKTSTVTDGYGGNTISETLIGSFWAEIKQMSSFKDNTIGKSDIKNSWSFKIRANSTLIPDFDNLSIDYKGIRYVVNDIVYNDELFREINIIANG